MHSQRHRFKKKIRGSTPGPPPTSVGFHPPLILSPRSRLAPLASSIRLQVPPPPVDNPSGSSTVGPGEEKFKMKNYLLYLSKIFRQVGLIKQCKLKLACPQRSSLIRDYTVCDYNPTQTVIPMSTNNILAYKSNFKSLCTATCTMKA